MVAAEIGDDLSKPFERVVEAVHPATFAGVGGDATFPEDGWRRRPEISSRSGLSRFV